jgi:DNA-binding response OmpR family regulator
LIVEDEPLIAMMLEDFLDSLGHTVAGIVDSVEDALAHIDTGGFDLAIVDVHLKDGKNVWPVADKLSEKGMPFILATGGHIDPPPTQYANVPVLSKPYTIDAVEPALQAAMSANAG